MNNADLTLFKDSEIKWLENKMQGDGKIECIIREKQIKLTPEEVVRQIYTYRLIEFYKYPKELIEFEKKIQFGREIDQKRADIVVYKNDKITPAIIIELKRPSEENDLSQLKSYLNAEGAPIGVATNGKIQTILFRPYPKDFDTLSDIPKYGEEIDDLFKKKKKFDDLEHPKNLKAIIKATENLVLANSGFDSFEEIFKLIYAKLYDEKQALEDKANYELRFYKYSKDSNKLKQEIDRLFEEAKKEWAGIFEKSDVIKLRPEHLSVVIGEIQKYCLLGSDLRVIDEAFEYLIPDVAKGKKGQFFTSREVIEMCVDMLQPQKEETVIDTACGSGGFLIQTMKLVQEQHNFTKQQLGSYASKKLFGIDFDDKSSKIAKAMMLIAGDGKSHIFKCNTLDTSDESWEEIMREFEKCELLPDFDDYDKNLQNKQSRKLFNFDVLLANPPFAGEVKEESITKHYELSKNEKGKDKNSIGRDVLFIERNLQFVRAGGRLALVLPQGRFNNTSDKQIREFLADKARILGVVGLHVNTFKPHTGTKTSVIFLQTWNDDASNPQYHCPRKEDYPVFFAVNEEPVRDNSGDYTHDHDLKEISAAFVEFAKEEGFGFIGKGYLQPFPRRYSSVTSIINLSEVKQNGWRLDGEYWKDYHSKSVVQYIKLGDIAKISGGKRLPLGEKFSEVGIPYIRAEDVQGFIDYNDSPKISEDLHKKIKNYQTKYNDVLLTIVGNSIGDVGIIKFELEKCNLTENAAKIYNLKNFLPEFLFVFFQTKYGQSQIKKESVGTAQPKLALCRIGEMKIPLLSPTFQTQIEQTVKTAHQLLEASKTAYKTAENLLLAEVFGSWKPTAHKNWHVKMLSEVQSAGRMDAEYFHAKYEDLIAQIKAYRGGWCELGAVFSQNKTTKSIKENEIYKYAEIGSVDTSSGEIIPLNIEGKDLPANAKIDLQIGNVIVSTVRSYRGAVGIVQESDMVGSGAFTVLQENSNFKKEALFVILRTALYKDFSQKFATGMSYPVITDDDVLHFPLPLLPQPLQTQIAQLVKQSFEDRTQSKALLQLAKTAVEKAIEEGEDAGLAEINSMKI